MQTMFRPMLWLGTFLAAAAVVPAAHAQVTVQTQPFVNPYRPHASVSGNVVAQPVRPVFAPVASVTGVRVQPVFAQPVATGIQVQTAVAVPDRGAVTLASYSQMSEARNEFGVPILGHVPYLGRAFRNVGYGRSGGSVRLIASVRIIDLQEEEYRQTGVGGR